MVLDFESALGKLRKEDLPLTDGVLFMLSCPSREETIAFETCWQQLSTARRRGLMSHMVTSAEADYRLDFVDLFRQCLDDADADVRRLAVEGLWEDTDVGLIGPLLELVSQDPDDTVRAAATISIGRFLFMAECEELSETYGARIRETLEGILQDPQEPVEVVRRVLEAMAFVNTDKMRRAISRFYDHEDERMRQSAIFAMGRSADRYWADIVLMELSNESPAMRHEAARASGEMELKDAVEQLINLVQQPDRQIRNAAVWSLGQIGGKRAEKALEHWAESNDPELGAAATEALAELRFLTDSMDLLVHEPLGTDLSEVDGDGAEEEDSTPDGDEDWADEFLDLI